VSEPPDGPSRLDPEAAAAARAKPVEEPPKREPVIDTRPYRWAIGIFGLVLVIAFSIYVFVSHGVGTAGVPPGKKLHLFVAPLATSSLQGDANLNPHCDPHRPNPQALNVCGRTPLVLGLFVTGSTDCEREIDTIQAVSTQFSPRRVQFGAVAVQAGHAKAAALVRSHHWTIPVAYDKDGAVGSLYGVAICPMVELAYRGGVVEDRLIGNHWLSRSRLAARVRRLLARQR
jgi:AhpC/TSA family